MMYYFEELLRQNLKICLRIFNQENAMGFLSLWVSVNYKIQHGRMPYSRRFDMAECSGAPLCI